MNKKIVHCDLADGLQLLNFVGNAERFDAATDEEMLGSSARGYAAAGVDGRCLLLLASSISIS